MILLKYILSNVRKLWVIVGLSLMGLAPQCYSSMPPLPPTPAGPTLRVAVLAPTTGELIPIGQVVKNSVMMAFDEWNNERGLLNHQLEGIIYPTDCTFETAQQATQQAIDEGVQFIIGPICSEAAIATALLAQPANVLTILPAATHPLVTVNHQGQPRPSIFRISYTYNLQGQAAARFAHNTLNVSRVALLSDPADDYTIHLTDAFANQFVTEGGKIIHRGTYNNDNTNFTKMLMTISQSGAELIYLPTTNTALVNQIADHLNTTGASSSNESTSILLGSDGWAADQLDLTATSGSYFAIHFSPKDRRPLVQSWVEDYKSAYAIAPNELAALSYDAANTLAQAIQQATTFESVPVAKVLEQGTFQGITGQITFDHHHNPVKPVHFVKIQAGRVTYFASISP